MRGVALESERLESATPKERLAFAIAEFGSELLFTSSFGAGSGVLLHMWSELARHLPVVFIDTGFLFDETHVYKNDLAEKLGLRVEIVAPTVDRATFMSAHGADIQASNPDFCCQANKVAPLAPLLARARGWVSGLRRGQSAKRQDVPILLDSGEGHVKVHPLATMSNEDVAQYMSAHGIPDHPLRARRYLSIGCQPCTRAVAAGEDERAGRWSGTEKTECGLHVPRGGR